VSDGSEFDLIKVGTHGGVGMLAAAVTAGIARFFAGKEAQDVAIKLALLEASMNDIKAELKGLREKSHDHGNNITRLLWSAGIEGPKRKDTQP
jgi:hypothetical protein